MKAHLIDTHLLVPKSRSSAKVKVKCQVHVSQKMGVLGALVFHKHILFFVLFSVDHLVATALLIPMSSSSAKVKVIYQGNIFF